MVSKAETLIVITRPAEEGAETATYFEQQGFRVHLAPIMEVSYRTYDRESLGQYDGFIVTSQQALKALGQDHACQGKILFAFGEKTLALAKAMGFEVRALAGYDMQEAMPDLIHQLQKKSGRFCYLRGADISYDIKAACAAAQIILDEAIVYEAKVQSSPILLPDAPSYALLLYSERSALSALKLISVPQGKKIHYFCLSQKVRNSIEMLDSSLKGSVFAPEIQTTQHLYDLISRTCM